MGLHIIVYMSEYTGDPDKAKQDIEAIARVAKEKNIQIEITGVLFYHDGKFVQIIEGPRHKLEELMLVLEKDNRHRNLKRLIDQGVAKRGFPDWNMDTFNLSDQTGLDAGDLQRVSESYRKNLLTFINSFLDAWNNPGWSICPMRGEVGGGVNGSGICYDPAYCFCLSSVL